MSAPIPADRLLQIFRDAGVHCIEMHNWKTHNRNSKGPWDNLHGVLIHHTGSDTSNPAVYAQNILYLGYSGLPGPLCHFGVAPNGDLYMVGYGRANHAGGGDPNSLSAVTNETTPLNGELHPTKGNSNGVDGNREFYGFEIMYSGGHPMTNEQMHTTLVCSAAICREHKWSGASVIGHREWSSDKIDPGHCAMDNFRVQVNSILGGAVPPPTQKPPPTTTPPPPSSGEKVPPVQGYQGDVYQGKLHYGQTNSDSVGVFQKACRNYPDVSTIPLNPSGITKNYFDETANMCEKLYRTWAQWNPSGGWDQGNLREPGPSMLKTLGCKIVG